MSIPEHAFDSKYHISGLDSGKALGLFSSFAFLKIKGNKNECGYGRPPYPILVSHPTYHQIFKNINKSDLFLWATFNCFGLANAIYSGRSYKRMHDKNMNARMIMSMVNLFCLCYVFAMSAGRLTGEHDNGLRWRDSENTHLYDFTSDFENNTKWKYFNDRR